MDRPTALKTLGLRLRKRREEAGITDRELAERAKLSLDAVLDFERGAGNLGTAKLLRIAAALGIDAGQLLHTDAPEQVARVEPRVMLRTKATNATLSDSDVEAIASATRRARAFAVIGELLRVSKLSDEFKPTPAPQENAWKSGYVLAQRVRALLPQREGPGLRNVRRLLEESFDVLVARHRFSSSGVDGAACRWGGARVIVINEALHFESTRRVVLTHELGHHLADLAEDDFTADERVEGGFSMERPPAERRANAFAVMFLAPEAELHRLLGLPGSVNVPRSHVKDFVEAARNEFGLGPVAMTRHLQNLHYISPPIADELVRELTGTDDTVRGFEDEPQLDGLERRVGAALDAGLISRGRARELLGLSHSDESPVIPST
jgi:transcriptional regulator with XRE-family HTH domain